MNTTTIPTLSKLPEHVKTAVAAPALLETQPFGGTFFSFYVSIYSYTNDYVAVLYLKEDDNVQMGPNDAPGVVWTISKFFYISFFLKNTN